MGVRCRLAGPRRTTCRYGSQLTKATILGGFMNLEEYAAYAALGLADLVRRRQVSAAELRDLGLRAIELLNPTLNALVAPMPEEAEASPKRVHVAGQGARRAV